MTPLNDNPHLGQVLTTSCVGMNVVGKMGKTGGTAMSTWDSFSFTIGVVIFPVEMCPCNQKQKSLGVILNP